MHVYNSKQGQMGLHLPQKLIVDNFAGAGGASMGLEMGFNRPVDIAINHDAEAIQMHEANHPWTKHYCESIWDVDPLKATGLLPVEWAHFSPDCTHHSKARGGKPKKKEIRGLAWIVIKWAIQTRPEVISLENVEEFQSWGPLHKGQPIKERIGETYEAFKAMLTSGISPDHPAVAELREFLPEGFDINPAINGLGYSVDSRELRACDYGVPTIRKRYFLLAKSDGSEINWPTPTHGKPDSEEVLAGQLLPYRTAAECIDWSIPAPSIFERKKPLAENTLKRIARGLKRYVIDSDNPFIVPEHTTAPFITEFANASNQRNMPGDEPLRTICAQVKGGHFALVSAFLAKHYGGGYTGAGVGMDSPTSTITTVDHHALVTTNLMVNNTGHSGAKTDSPVPTITTGNNIYEVRAFLLKYYGNDKCGQSIIGPLHTIPTRDRFGLVTIHGTEYQIVDIGMRMLEPHELYKAQGFPDGYIHNELPSGKKLTKVAQVRMVGNSVPPALIAALVKANKRKADVKKEAA